MYYDIYRWLEKEVAAGLDPKSQYHQNAVMQCVDVNNAYLKARHSDVDWVPDECDKFMDAWLNGNKTGLRILADFDTLYKQGHPEPAPPTPVPVPDPGPAPQPGGEITSFLALPVMDDSDNCYFTVCRVNGEILASTYKDGSYQSMIYDLTHKERWRFNAESGFMIILFKGRYYMSQEHGDYSTVDRGMVRCLENGAWKEVYRHPRWDLITEMHVHGNYLYASGCCFGNDSDPAGIVRTFDGVTWEEWLVNPYEYRFWGMTSGADGALWTAATSSGADWGKNNCNPSVFRNKDLMWRDKDHPNSGFWAIEAWHNDLFLGRCGDAAVVRYSDKKEVLTMPGYEAIHDLAIDKKTDTLLAFVNGGPGGAIVMATKNGENWYEMDKGFTVPSIIDGYYDDQEEAIYLATGKFGGNGRLYKSRRRV